MIHTLRSIIQIFKKYPFLTVFVSVTIFFIICAISLPIQFEENDDVTMLLLSSGAYSASPEIHLIYINAVFGVFLKFWYLIFPEIEWYSVWFSILHILSISILVFLLIRNVDNKLTKICGVIVLLLFEQYFIANFQFTTTSMLCILAGFMLFVFGKKRIEFVASISLTVIGVLLRIESFVLVLTFFISYFLFVIVRKDFFRIKVLAGILILTLTVVLIDKAIYNSNDNWKYFQNFRIIKAGIVDNPNSIDYLNSNIKGNQKKDFTLFLISLFEKDIMNNQTLQKINSNVTQKNIFNIFISMIEVLKSFLIGNYAKYLLPILFLCLFAFLQLIGQNTFQNRAGIIITTAIFIFLILYIPVFRTLKLRAFISILFVFFIITLLLHNSRNVIVNVLSIVCFYFIANFMYRLTNNSRNYNKRKSYEYVIQSQLMNRYSNKLVPIGCSFIIEGENPFTISRNWKTKKIFSLALVGSPINEGICNRYTDFINGPGLFMGKSSVPIIAPMIIESIQRNYGIKCSYRVAIQDKESAIIEFYKE